MFGPVALTRGRMWLAYGVAITADVIQWVLGPVGWFGSDEVVDVVAMLAISKLIGFHALLLPAFVLEFMPMADMLPTWTGCVALVLFLRKKQDAIAHPPPGPGPVIDI